VWVKIYFVSSDDKKKEMIRKCRESNYGCETPLYSKILYEIDCELNTFRTLMNLSYGLWEQDLHSWTVLEPLPWVEHIVPETHWNKLKSIVCK